MKYNIIGTKNDFINIIKNMEVKSSIDVNIVSRLITITKYTNGYVIWWGDSYGIDCKDYYEICDKLEMLTSFIIEGEINKNECYITKEMDDYMKESTKC